MPRDEIHYYFIGKDGVKYGPANIQALKDWRSQGRINSATILENSSTGEHLLASYVFDVESDSIPDASPTGRSRGRAEVGLILAIDIGNSNIACAVLENGKAVPLNITEPAMIAFEQENPHLIVGESARVKASLNHSNTFKSLLRLVGKPPIYIPALGRDVRVEELLAYLFQHIRTRAEICLGMPVNNVVVTVPNIFNYTQIARLRMAVEMSGMKVIRAISNTSATVLANELDKRIRKTVQVWDLGGGTLDVSIIEIGEGVIEVQSKSGDICIGGDDWDERIVNYICDEFKAQQGIDLRKDMQALQRMHESAEKAKIELSSLMQTNINLPYITSDTSGPKHLNVTLSRAKFEDLTSDLLDKCVEVYKRVMSCAGLKEDDLDEIILVGGASRMPMVYELIKRITGGRNPKKCANADEVVAVGAAIQSGILSGEISDTILMDVTPYDLGIETIGENMDTIIECNTTIPTRKSMEYTIAYDGETKRHFNVLQGDFKNGKHSRSIGRFSLSDISPVPKGVCKVEVTFDVDAECTINVSAKDMDTGERKNLTVPVLEDIDIGDSIERFRAFVASGVLSKGPIDDRIRRK